MEKTKKAYEIVIDSIKEQIMNQELVLGQGLPPEREISEKLGVSRNSVREALKILTVMGVVSSRQGAGNYISGNFKGYMVDALSMMFMLDKLDYDQINQIRIGLEMQAYALAVKNAETKDIIELQEYVNALDQSTDNDEKTMYDKTTVPNALPAAHKPLFLQDRVPSLRILPQVSHKPFSPPPCAYRKHNHRQSVLQIFEDSSLYLTAAAVLSRSQDSPAASVAVLPFYALFLSAADAEVP